MSVYLVYADANGQSHLAEMDVARDLPYMDPPLDTPGWRTMVWETGPRVDSFHASKGHGSVQIVLSGALRISVTGGEMRSRTGIAGDVFVFVDVTGDGHQAERVGDEPMRALNIRLGPDRSTVKKAFADWPEDAFDFA